ncbi:jg21369, partial [Pararge aegeria aegeria]
LLVGVPRNEALPGRVWTLGLEKRRDCRPEGGSWLRRQLE